MTIPKSLSIYFVQKKLLILDQAVHTIFHPPSYRKLKLLLAFPFLFTFRFLYFFDRFSFRFGIFIKPFLGGGATSIHRFVYLCVCLWHKKVGFKTKTWNPPPASNSCIFQEVLEMLKSVFIGLSVSYHLILKKIKIQSDLLFWQTADLIVQKL